ncbi:HAUS augmin-like complex subunit 5 [Pantherophis guttatus]|uniref:HAUS augmin-like complex subunit 5 n=1 Tax=Pantherophis guttatus TaxID=94885 RepID=A0A6P9C5U4_PANGU|nr:HAUS augmin-like complex subunit 5 [Pantherophis guttatus]
MASGENAAARRAGKTGASLAQDLRRWAAEEMKLPPGKVPSERDARRMCSGQCADIWKYIIRHVHHQRTVKKIRGNLLWYQQMEKGEVKPSASESDKERRKHLIQAISRLKEEDQQLDLQIELAQREFVASEVTLETTQIWDAKRRSLLLKAYSTRVTAERQQLHKKGAQVKGRLEQLEEMEKKAKTVVAFGGRHPEPRFPILEPEVLRDVQESCQLRFQFLKTLFENSISGSSPETDEEEMNITYQHWLSTVEKVVGTHPPAHILSALEHLARQNTMKLQEVTDKINISQDVAALKFRYNSTHLQDVSDSADKLPSVRVLIQEGWSKCEMLCVQQIPLHAEEKGLLSRLEALVKEMHGLLSDGSERSILARTVFELELRAVRLRGYRDGLLQGCQELEEAVKARYAELQNLQAKRQRILDFRHLVNEKQQHIRVLIKGTSFLKSQLRKNQAEIQDFIQKKLLPQAQQVQLETQQLHDRVGREVQHFKSIALPCLLTRQIAGSEHIPAHKLSIHHLSRTALSENRAFLNVCNGVSFPLYKAPEQLLLHLAELKKMLAYLCAQLSSKQRALGSLQHQLESAPEPDVPALVGEVQSHDQKQAFLLLPCIQRTMDQCQCLLKRRPEIQAVIDTWWEQPGQLVLPHELRYGFTLQQWLERWTLAAKNLQQQQMWL